MDLHLLKTIHILSATVLFGTGVGTAFHMWTTHLRGDVRAIAVVARNVVLADWLFTTTAGVVQAVTGFMLVRAGGYDPTASWLVAAYVCYVIAGLCWLPVVTLQIKIARFAWAAAEQDVPLPDAYHHAMRVWFRLGWPAFLALLVAFWLMVAKPELW